MRTPQQQQAKALELATVYTGAEKDLLNQLMEMDADGSFPALGYTGLFNFCLHCLKFCETKAAYFASIARKSKEVPELKRAIDTQVLSISKAKRILKVITPDTQEEWITKAATLKQRDLDRQVAAVNPSAVRERVRPVSLDRHEMRLSMSESCKAKLDRAKDLMKENGLEVVLEKLLDTYLDKCDPVRKAERTSLKGSKPGPTQVRHAVNRRDRGKCQWPGCENTRYVDQHHIVYRSQGGEHTEDNITTLCSAHHRMLHQRH